MKISENYMEVTMEAFYFSLAILCFGITIMIFIELLLNSGLKEALDISKKSVKLMVGIFIMYVLSFSSYILYQVL
jgi:hypothetical protein